MILIADGSTAKPAVQPTDGAANLGQQTNAAPNKADNDDISSFTDEAEEKPQMPNGVANTNSVPQKGPQTAEPVNKVFNSQKELYSTVTI